MGNTSVLRWNCCLDTTAQAFLSCLPCPLFSFFIAHIGPSYWNNNLVKTTFVVSLLTSLQKVWPGHSVLHWWALNKGVKQFCRFTSSNISLSKHTYLNVQIEPMNLKAPQKLYLKRLWPAFPWNTHYSMLVACNMTLTAHVRGSDMQVRHSFGNGEISWVVGGHSYLQATMVNRKACINNNLKCFSNTQWLRG